MRPVVPYTLALSFTTLSAGGVSGSPPTGSHPRFLPQGGSSSSESSALLLKLQVFQKVPKLRKTYKTRQSSIEALFSLRNHRLIIHKCNEGGPLHRDSSRFPRRRPFIKLNRHTPSGQSRVYRVTQLRTDGVTAESPPAQGQ